MSHVSEKNRRFDFDKNEASVVFKLMKGEGFIDWREPAMLIERRVRAFDPWPGTWTVLPPDLRRPGTGGRVRIEYVF